MKLQIKEVATRKGMTIEELAEKYGLSVNSLYNWNSRENANPSIEHVVKIANALDCSVDELVGRSRIYPLNDWYQHNPIVSDLLQVLKEHKVVCQTS